MKVYVDLAYRYGLADYQIEQVLEMLRGEGIEFEKHETSVMTSTRSSTGRKTLDVSGETSVLLFPNDEEYSKFESVIRSYLLTRDSDGRYHSRS